jgi:hypothetical protein
VPGLGGAGGTAVVPNLLVGLGDKLREPGISLFELDVVAFRSIGPGLPPVVLTPSLGILAGVGVGRRGVLISADGGGVGVFTFLRKNLRGGVGDSEGVDVDLALGAGVGLAPFFAADGVGEGVGVGVA